MLQGWRFACIGAGNMAEAIFGGLLRGGHVSAAQLMASDIRPGRLANIRDAYQIATAEKNAEVAAWADVILLAVEPQVLDEVLREIASVVDDSKLVLSVAAGYPIARLERYLPGTRRIVRAMPNTPSSIREGITALAYAAGLDDEDVRTAKALFDTIGKVVEVAERALDAVTGLSGSGPAYVYVMIEALADGGVKMGLPRATAQLLAAQTVAGSACMVIESQEHPGMLKNRVASPGGTTIAGLHELERGRLRATLMSAVEAATKRSMELGLAT
jgi:pyrroline-5-carboxylate reductase